MATQNITVKLENGFIIFMNNGNEFYDFKTNIYYEFLPRLKEKTWFTENLRKKTESLFK